MHSRVLILSFILILTDLISEWPVTIENHTHIDAYGHVHYLKDFQYRTCVLQSGQQYGPDLYKYQDDTCVADYMFFPNTVTFLFLLCGGFIIEVLGVVGV